MEHADSCVAVFQFAEGSEMVALDHHPETSEVPRALSTTGSVMEFVRGVARLLSGQIGRHWCRRRCLQESVPHEHDVAQQILYLEF